MSIQCGIANGATDSLSDAHQAQVLHYAALLNRNRIKLINFGAPRVEGHLVGTPFAGLDRWDVNVDRKRWQPISKNCDKLVDCAEELLRSWGGFLHCRLFRNALAWFSGRDCCKQRLPVTRTSRTLGRHPVLLHDSRCGFVVTSLHDELACYESQLRRLLDALPIDGWQWLNFYHRELRITSLVK